MKRWIAGLTVVLFASMAGNGFLLFRLNETVGNDEVLLASLRSDIAGIEEQIVSLNGALQTVSGNIPGLSDSVGSLQTDVSGTRDQVASLDDNVQTINEDVSRLAGLVDGLQARSAAGLGTAADLTKATEAVRPSVVVIETETLVTVFPGRRIVQQGAGSGWIIRDGIIVTNNHVVAGAASIRVTLADGRSFASTATQTSAATDLAIIRIDARDLPAVKIGDSSKLQVGQPVAAIGNALGLGINMTGGWVSRLNTSVAFSDGTRLSGLIGTDAAINPGNSGGPLVNMDGEVIGITNAKLVETGVESIGYAISINDAMDTLNRLVSAP